MRKKLLSVLLATSMVFSAGASFAAETETMEDTSINVFTEFKTGNLIVNGGFENGLEGWETDDSGVFTIVENSFTNPNGATHKVINGTKAVKATVTNTKTAGYIYQEVDVTANTNYALNLSWFHLANSKGSVKIYGESIASENLLANTGNIFGGEVWYSSTATFNSGKYEKIIIKIDIFNPDTAKYPVLYFCVDNITLKAAGTTQTIDFEEGYPEDINIRSANFEVTTEKAYTGEHSLKLTSGTGYPIANAVFALNPERHYAVMFWYYIESGALGAAAKHSHENGWSGYTTNPIASETVKDTGEWKRAILTPNDGVTGSGANKFVEIAFQNMAPNTVVYIDNIQCKYYDESVDSITITGQNEDGGVLHADVKAYNYGYNFEDPVNYQWQKSDDKEEWYDVEGATSEDYKLTRADSKKYLRLKVNTTNRYSESVTDSYYSKAVSIGDISYKHKFGSEFGAGIENAEFSVDDNGAESKFEVLNKTENTLDFSVFVGAYSETGEVIDFSLENYSEIAANGKVSVESKFEAEEINDFRIIVFDDNMNVYYAEDIENKGSDETEDKVEFDKETQEITITGEIESTPGFIIIKNEAGEIEYINVFDCGDKPGFEIKTNIEADACGKHYVYTNYYDEPAVIIYYSDADYERIINNFSNETITGEQIKEAFSALEADDSLLNALDFDKLTSFINEVKIEVEGSDLEAKKEDLKTKLEKNCVLESYNQKIDGLTDKEGKLLYAKTLGLKDIDKDGVTIFDIYDNMLTKEGLTELDKSLKGKNIKSLDEFIDIFEEEVILKAIAYPNVGGNGYIDNVITKENMEAVGADTTKYFDKNKTEKNKTKENIIKEVFASIDDLANELNKKVTVSNGNGGGGSSSSGHSGGTGVVISNPTPNVTEKEATKSIDEFKFNDVPGAHWAYKYIYALNEIDVINGVSDEEFNPEGIVTREQIVKMLCEALKLEKGEKDVQFGDVLQGAWYEKYIDIVASNEIVNGIGDGKFGVGMPVTRQDLCVMVMNAIATDVKDNQLDFNDSDEISDYAKEAVATLSMMKVISGFSDGAFRPKDICTRAQAAKIIYEIMGIKEVMN